ncbi:MAG: hypothetical protein WBN18_05275 [Flavobacteriaceae bacterium]
MADINILVSRIGETRNLSLKQGTNDPGDDELETIVDVNQTIKWSLDPSPDPGRNNGITIVSVKKADASIPKYRNSQQLLIHQPTVTNGIANGQVVPVSPGSGKFENYSIGFTINSDPEPRCTYYDDPRLIMR